MAKILIIDDSENMRVFVCDFLRKFGHDIIAMDNGKSGLKAFEMHNPNIVIVDMLMPIMDGREFIIRIRKLPQGVNTPIIIVSAYVSIKQVMDLLNMGATYFMNKPISLDSLKDHIDRSLFLINKNQMG
jgi:DNA-binding response OmpR family regulator